MSDSHHPQPPSVRPNTTMRSDNPELWDLERQFERRQAAQVAEIFEKSQRVVELMERIESLEPLAHDIAERDGEIERMKQAHTEAQAAGRKHAAELERRLETLAGIASEVEGLRERLQHAKDEVRERDDEVDALRLQSSQEKAHLEQQVEQRDHWLEEARASQATAERESDEKIAHLRDEVRERERQIETAKHANDALQTELESKESALSRRDEMILEGDEKAARLREEVRERDRRLDGANQAGEALRAELRSKDSELGVRGEHVRELEAEVGRQGGELEALRAELARANEELEARGREKRELTEAWTEATAELEQQRAKLHTSAGHLLATQSVISELRPMLESLETKLTSEAGEPAVHGDEHAAGAQSDPPVLD